MSCEEFKLIVVGRILKLEDTYFAHNVIMVRTYSASYRIKKAMLAPEQLYIIETSYIYKLQVQPFELSRERRYLFI